MRLHLSATVPCSLALESSFAGQVISVCGPERLVTSYVSVWSKAGLTVPFTEKCTWQVYVPGSDPAATVTFSVKVIVAGVIAFWLVGVKLTDIPGVQPEVDGTTVAASLFRIFRIVSET